MTLTMDEMCSTVSRWSIIHLCETAEEGTDNVVVVAAAAIAAFGHASRVSGGAWDDDAPRPSLGSTGAAFCGSGCVGLLAFALWRVAFGLAGRALGPAAVFRRLAAGSSVAGRGLRGRRSCSGGLLLA